MAMPDEWRYIPGAVAFIVAPPRADALNAQRALPLRSVNPTISGAAPRAVRRRKSHPSTDIRREKRENPERASSVLHTGLDRCWVGTFHPMRLSSSESRVASVPRVGSTERALTRDDVSFFDVPRVRAPPDPCPRPRRPARVPGVVDLSSNHALGGAPRPPPHATRGDRRRGAERGTSTSRRARTSSIVSF